MVLGLVIVAFSFSKLWFLSLILVGIIGFGQSVRMTVANILLQEYVQDEYVGRVMSLYLMQFGFTSLSAFAAGVMTDSIGLSLTIGGFAAILVIVSFAVFMFVPKIRKLD